LLPFLHLKRQKKKKPRAARPEAFSSRMPRPYQPVAFSAVAAAPLEVFRMVLGG
jgi:hypothetical protein